MFAVNLWLCLQLEWIYNYVFVERTLFRDNTQFDRSLNLRGIKHIRTAIHSPTTSGKIERFFQTLDKEFKFCNKDAELFRMRYNHFRPHASLNNCSPA